MTFRYLEEIQNLQAFHVFDTRYGVVWEIVWGKTPKILRQFQNFVSYEELDSDDALEFVARFMFGKSLEEAIEHAENVEREEKYLADLENGELD